jgi:glutaredoxin
MVKLYSTNCPKCIILEKKLQSKNISFELKNTEEDINYMIEQGFTSAPILEVDGNLLTFAEANEYVNNV